MNQPASGPLKRRQRRLGLSARESLPPEEAARASSLICRRLLERLRLHPAPVIFTYVPHGAEADISAFNREAERRGCAVAYPVCLGGGIMVAAQPLAPDAWEAGPYGIPSPRLSRSRIVAPEDIRLALVPCAAFDRQCRRVGMGAGYYDRYLPGCVHAFRAAAAFEVQRVNSAVQEPWDVPLHAVATEARWYGQA